MIKHKYSILFFLLLQLNTSFAQKLTNWVNPFIGTTNFGTTNPGAVVPQGMVSVSPFNVTGSEQNKWDKDKRWWSTPYSSDNHFLTGFSHVNLSGVGCPDLGVILLMPTTGAITADCKEYGAFMSEELAKPGFYSCSLDKYDIRAEVTATPRTGLSKFTFPKGQSNVLIDLGIGLTNESGAKLKLVNDQEVEGWRMIGDFCYHGNSERPVYFVARFNKKAKSYGTWKKMPTLGAEADWSSTSNKFKYYEKSLKPIAGDSIGCWFTFDTEGCEEVMVELGISYVSIDNARQNLNFESSEFNFETTRNEANSEWEEVLSKILVDGGSNDQKTIFYTALYHMHIHPNIINDVNGEYPMMESDAVGIVKDRNRYSVFSLWDTYRNFHPLMSLVYPELQLDMVRSIVDMYKESGWLPKWELISSETYTMNGDPAFPVITDTYLRGLTDFDINMAYDAMYKHATTVGKSNKIRPDIDFYLEHGYLPLVEEYDNSTSIALEYYLADWNLGQLAKKLGKHNDYMRFNNQSHQYAKYFDGKAYNMIRPLMADGSFLSQFDPMQGKDFEPVPGFHEGTAWQYTFCVQHDIPGLIRLMKGKAEFTKTLQKVFDDQLFDMANEPDMHYPFLFNYVKGEEWRAQKETSKLINQYFKNAPDGLPGNDDCGTMSAWTVFAMMGMYPVCPGNMDFALTKPVFERVKIELDHRYYPGKEFVITQKGGVHFIDKIKLNDKNIEGYFITHQQIVSGGKLEIITK